MDGRFFQHYRILSAEESTETRGDILAFQNGTSNLILNGNCNARFQNRLSDREAAILFIALKATEVVLYEIDLSYNTLGDQSAEKIADYLRTNGTVTSVNLAFNDIGSRGGRAIADALMLNTKLETLNLTGNDLGEHGGMSMATMLRANKTIQSLNLSSCGIQTSSIISIATSIRNHPTLTSLNLDKPLLPGVQEGQSVATHLSEALKVNDTLADLHLARWKMNDEQLEIMTPSLVRNKSIVSIDFSCNRLSSISGGLMAHICANTPSLVYLQLSANMLDSDGAIAIAKALTPHSAIQFLDLTNNGIGERGLLALADMLEANLSIMHIRLWGNDFSKPTCVRYHTLEQRLARLLSVDFATYVVDDVPQVLLKDNPF